jgi:uncharacterized membrane protein YgcG
MVSPGWARLRPVNADLRRVVTFLTLAVSVALAVAGVWSIANFLRLDGRRDGVSFTVYVYVIVFGVLLALGELGVPPQIFAFFGFLASSSGRAFFLLFASTLAASAGWSGDRGRVSSILLIVSGLAGVVTSFFGLCYGCDHYADEPLAAPGYASNDGGGRGGGGGGGGVGGGGGGGGGIGGFFGRGREANSTPRATPDNVI